MALKLKTDCGQTRGQYPAPPPRMHLVRCVSDGGEIGSMFVKKF